jgi:hypothetical protein
VTEDSRTRTMPGEMRSSSSCPAAPSLQAVDSEQCSRLAASLYFRRVNRHYAIAAVRAEADRAGADVETLLVSQKFVDQLSAMDVEAPGFPGRVRELVSTTAATTPDSGQSVAAESGPTGRAQWTIDDVRRASPSEVREAQDAGLLRDLGMGPRHQRR